jgi:hypothetical protein
LSKTQKQILKNFFFLRSIFGSVFLFVSFFLRRLNLWRPAAISISTATIAIAPVGVGAVAEHADGHVDACGAENFYSIF